MQIRLTSVYLALALAVGSSSAAPSSSSTSFVVRESVNAAPAGFTKSNSVALTSQTLTLRMQLAQNNIPGLEDELYAVSTPGSAKYGQHLSAAEVASYVAPTEETTTLVNAWLQANGVTAKPVSNAGDWVEISLPLSQANELFNTEFTTYEDASGNQFVRTLSYSVPSDLESHIDLVHPTVNFPVNPLLPSKKRTLSKRATPPSSCEDEITPTCLQALYSIPTTPATSTSNSLWVSAFVAEYADHADVASFIKEYRPDIPSSVNTTFAVVEINGGTNSENPEDAGLEAILDVEYTVGLATGVPVTFLSVGPDDADASDAEFVQAVLFEADYLVGLANPPHVLTTSYGVDETEVTAALANSICNAYMQLGTRGTSVIYASGDGGVAGGHGDSCTNEPFIPVFPAACPYLTSVGATEYDSGSTETAADFSSGGFSDIFARPSYQSSAVETYIKGLGSTYSGRYNATGRGFPDVSANGVDFVLFYAGEDGVLVDGTSCASPTFASVIALVNDQLLAAGKSPLGFLNPFLYANPTALNDITSGDNPGCGTNGFSAKAGWDPITGLGTPNFPALVKAALA